MCFIYIPERIWVHDNMSRGISSDRYVQSLFGFQKLTIQYSFPFLDLQVQIQISFYKVWDDIKIDRMTVGEFQKDVQIYETLFVLYVLLNFLDSYLICNEALSVGNNVVTWVLCLQGT